MRQAVLSPVLNTLSKVGNGGVQNVHRFQGSGLRV